VRAMEGFARTTGLLPEQVWDADDLPEAGLWRGRPTGSAMPLAWAHAEYVKLLRSVRDGRAFDLLPAVRDRYVVHRECVPLEIWKFDRRPESVPGGRTLRVQAAAPFRLRWSADGWETVRDTEAASTAVGVHFVDLAAPRDGRAPLAFTFYWTGPGRWEGRDFGVEIRPAD
ncbi:MAG TPA: glucan 1,4-alpha-glucosidase, partial [Gemmatimonadota bacterium]|nr:glucan 1,4-alpha-glucosidase [Gemmatimonadota bacterium]